MRVDLLSRLVKQERAKFAKKAGDTSVNGGKGSFLRSSGSLLPLNLVLASYVDALADARRSPLDLSELFAYFSIVALSLKTVPTSMKGFSGKSVENVILPLISFPNSRARGFMTIGNASCYMHCRWSSNHALWNSGKKSRARSRFLPICLRSLSLM